MTVTPTPLARPTRLWLRARHAARLTRDASRYGRAAGLWWLVPLLCVLGLVGLALTATTSALPLTVYVLI